MGVPAERGMAIETTLIAPFAISIIAAFGWSDLPYGNCHQRMGNPVAGYGWTGYFATLGLV